ncbi:MAG TPA: hypothetical protein VM802_28000 [Chitinophaga sp.]|uniref:hypothetical protein n=1 Tax=Chitinophaga sp. TaxID=1869181 RepID=UPI002C5DE299|nr:hypothetical protein [Chitinophaga sp.]HVI48744.1 hypothetical protein [Chitinophaga sp.]
MKFRFLTSLVIAGCLAGTSAHAQIYMDGVDGKPIRESKYVDVQGTPYLQDEWAKGSIQMKIGKTFTDLMLKYDMVEDAPLFKGKQGESIYFAEFPQAFTITDLKDNHLQQFRSGYKPVKGATAQSYYEVLADGKVQLLKRKVKVLREDKPYGSATTVRKIDENINYFIAKDGQPVNIKKSERAVLEAIGDKNSELEAYIRSNKLNVKNDEDLIKLVAYYNGL